MKLPVVHSAFLPSSRRSESGLPGIAAAPRWGSALKRAQPVLFVLLAGCGASEPEKYPMTTFAPRSESAAQLNELFDLTLVLGVAVGVLVFVLLSYIILRFRYQPGDPEPQQVHGNTRLELAWTLIPALILAVIAVPTVRTIFATYDIPDEESGALVVDVIGWQWWFEFRYPMANGDTVITANEIHIPTGRPVVLRLRGGDIIHNFWVPQMGGKRYAIPNRVNELSFVAEEPGIYLGQCAEFCGTSHALMWLRLVAHTPEGFAEWLRNEASPAIDPEGQSAAPATAVAAAAPAAQPALAAPEALAPAPPAGSPDGPAVPPVGPEEITVARVAALPGVPVDSAVLLGKQLTTAGACAGCHVIKGTTAIYGRQGPNLTHFARRRTLAAGVLENNAENLAAWIRDPQAIKPDARMPNLGLKEDEIRYIVAYLQTLY